MKKRVGIVISVLITVMLVASSYMLQSAYGDKEKDKGAATTPQTSQTTQAPQAKTCYECHENSYKTFKGTLHGMHQDPRSPAGQKNCDSCHGSSETHVKTEGKSLKGLVTFDSKTDVKTQNNACLSCHSTSKKQAMWTGSVHETRGLSCSSCHSSHSGNPKYLKLATQPETCATCHKQVRSDLLKSSHHPIKEGKVSCSDCHNPHGSVSDKLVTANSVNEKCWECHTEKRGPFLWQHPIVSENCLNCHTPHGGNHPKLLVAKPPMLCQQCHSDSRHPGTSYFLNTTNAGQSVYTASSSRLFYRSCVQCHSQIHGTNHPSGKTLTR